MLIKGIWEKRDGRPLSLMNSIMMTCTDGNMMFSVPGIILTEWCICRAVSKVRMLAGQKL